MVLKKGDGSFITVERSEDQIVSSDGTLRRHLFCFWYHRKVHSDEKLYVLKTFGKLYVFNFMEICAYQ